MTAMAKVNIFKTFLELSNICLGWLVRPSQGRPNAGQDSPGQICWGGGCHQLHPVPAERESRHGQWGHSTSWWRIPCNINVILCLDKINWVCTVANEFIYILQTRLVLQLDIKLSFREAFKKKSVTFFKLGGGGSGPVFVTLFFSKTWSKMA